MLEHCWLASLISGLWEWLPQRDVRLFLLPKLIICLHLLRSRPPLPFLGKPWSRNSLNAQPTLKMNGRYGRCSHLRHSDMPKHESIISDASVVVRHPLPKWSAGGRVRASDSRLIFKCHQLLWSQGKYQLTNLRLSLTCHNNLLLKSDTFKHCAKICVNVCYRLLTESCGFKGLHFAVGGSGVSCGFDIDGVLSIWCQILQSVMTFAIGSNIWNKPMTEMP